jgi:hypothetical protein
MAASHASIDKSIKSVRAVTWHTVSLVPIFFMNLMAHQGLQMCIESKETDMYARESVHLSGSSSLIKSLFYQWGFP